MFSDIGDLTVTGPGFEDKDIQIKLSVSSSWISQNAVHRRRQPLLDFWSLVKGEVPPVNNIGFHEDGIFPDLLGLNDAHTVFRGLERPLDDDDSAERIYIFLMQPTVHYGLITDMACIAKLRKAPANAIFACYVERYDEETPTGESGIVLSWEWVKADQKDQSLPEDWQERYREQSWRK
ncbi:MAG: hypothetical protein AAGC79_16835 [Pseudomonadota bacterium]